MKYNRKPQLEPNSVIKDHIYLMKLLNKQNYLVDEPKIENKEKEIT